MFHPFNCPKCGGRIQNHSWFCPYCETNLKEQYTHHQNPHCFIATAAYGTPWHRDIDALRDFRDSVLEKNAFGKAFVEMYYEVSPQLAKLVSRNQITKKCIRILIKAILKFL